MSSHWHTRYKFPVSFPTEPVNWFDPRFKHLFIRTKMYDELDSYLANIRSQFGKFWVSSPSGGFGKSTMLHYITRELYLKTLDWKALPFHLYVSEKTYASVEHVFIKDFLDELSKLDQNLRKACRVLEIDLPDEIGRTVIKGFNKHKKGIERFRADLPTMDVRKLEAKFYEAMEKVLQPWKNSGIFSKYVLLIDEMDKLDPVDVLTFLSGNQHLFEQLYDEYGFVVFLSGHRSWVEKIREGTEYSYYQGKIFRLPPFVDPADVKQLVETRLTQCLFMVPADNPWITTGYEKLQDVTGGAPRKILQLATEVMNQAYHKKVAKIGSGIVEDALIKEEYVEQARNYLASHYQTYMKLKQALTRKVADLLYIFYDTPKHQISKEYDRNLAARTRYLGIELSDDEWNDKIKTLVHLECLQDREAVRELSADITRLFDQFSGYPAMIQKVIPRVIRELREIKPIAREIPPPEYMTIIKRCLDISPNKWFSEEEIFDWFFNSVGVQAYIKQRKTRDQERLGRRIFSREFKKYLVEDQLNLMIFDEDSKKFYRRLPVGMSKADYEQAKKLRSKEVIDSFINLVIRSSAYDWNIIKRLDAFVEEILKKICLLKMVKFEYGILRKKKRHELFRRLELASDLRRHINFYIRESKEALPATGIIKETIQAITFSLAEIYDQLALLPEEEPSKEDYAALRTLEKILRRHIESKLGEISGDWWKERIPPDVRENAEERKMTEEIPWPWYPKKDRPLVCYVDFADYGKIILRRNNWRDAFKRTFGSIAQIQASLERLEPIRNTIAHNRALTPDQKRILTMEAKFISDSIRNRSVNQFQDDIKIEEK